MLTELNKDVTKMNDKYAAEYSKNCMFGRKMICVRCINCSYYNIAKGICLLDKMAAFVYTGKFSYK